MKKIKLIELEEMKKLSKFIQEQSRSFDMLFIQQCYDMLLENRYNYHILESDAQYKGQFELSEFLTFEILKKHSNDCKLKFAKNELKNKFDNIFFSKLQLIYKDIDNSGGYDNKNSEIIIYINSKENVKYENIFSCISHELKHAWQDYKKIHTSIKNLSSTNLYLNSVKDLKKSLAANIIYRTINHEYDAFGSEFSSEFKIEVYKNEPKSLQDCAELAKKTNVYNEIYQLYNICENLNRKNEYFGYTKEFILDEANKVLDKEITWQNFYNKYVNKLRKLFEKLCNIVANIYYKYVDENEKINESYNGKSTKFLVKLYRKGIINEYT